MQIQSRLVCWLPRIAGILALAWSLTGSLSAQRLTPGAALNIGFSRIGRSNQINSGAGAVGASLKIGENFLGMAMLDGATYLAPASTRYLVDFFSNGQSRCRDTTNGQFAATALCNKKRRTIGAGMFDADVLIPKIKLIAGGGYRTGANRGAYATGGALGNFPNPKSQWFFRTVAGRSIFQVHVGIIFGLR